jgi:hypothetical protein
VTLWRQTHFDTPDESTGGAYPIVSGTPWKAADKWAWTDGTDWYITADLGPSFWLSDDHTTPKGTALTTDFRIYNGRRYFVGGGWAVWYNGTAWVISNGVGVCVAENYYVPTGTVTYNSGTDEYDVFDTTEDPPVLLASFEAEGDADDYLADWIEANSYYEGDDWYSGGGDLETAFVPRGNLRGAYEGFNCGDRLFVTWSIAGLKLTDGDGPNGKYSDYTRDVDITETADPSPTHVDCPQPTYTFDPVEVTGDEEDWLGLALFKDQFDVEYLESLDGTRYGVIYEDGTGWIIGSRGSASGWYTGTEPDVDTPVTFTRQKTETGSYPGPENLTITFDSYQLGENTTRNTTGVKTYIGQVGLWL